MLDYRTSVHVTTNKTPAELQVGRKISTKFDRVLERKGELQEQHYKGKQEVKIKIGDIVIARDYRGNKKWQQGKVVEIEGNVIVVVETIEGERWRRHVDQVIVRKSGEMIASKDTTSGIEEEEEVEEFWSGGRYERKEEQTAVLEESMVEPPILHRSKRTIRKPDRLNL